MITCFHTAYEMEKSIFVDQSVTLYHQQSFSTQGGKGSSFCVYLRIFWDSFMCVRSVEVVLLSETAVNQSTQTKFNVVEFCEKCFESVKLYKEWSDVYILHVFFQKQHIIFSRPPFLFPFRQNLVVEGERYPIILNTHFSQKVCVETKQDNAAVAVEKCRPPPLTRCLWRSGTSQVSTEKSIPCKQVRQLFPLMWSWEENRNSQKRDRIDFGFSVKVLTCCWNGDSCRFLCDTHECRWLMSYVFMHEYLLKCENKTEFSCSTRPWYNKFMMQHTFPVILLLKITKVQCTKLMLVVNTPQV